MDILLVLAAILVLGWVVFVQFSARQQIDVVAALSERDAARVVADHFGAVWTQVPGAGMVNYRPRLRMNAPTLSISFQPSGTAACTVSIWTSAWTHRFGVMAHAQLMWRRKRRLATVLGRSVGERAPAA